MHWRNRLFITASLLYALVGGLIALTRLADPGLLPGDVTRLHAHVMLLGFVIMMIYGVGLHVLPRFSGRPLFSERTANWQFYTANLGLWIMAGGWLTFNPTLVMAGGSLTWLAIGLFSLNVLLTVRHYGPR